MKIQVLILFSIFLIQVLFGQNKDSLSKQLAGKWTACISMELLDNKPCKSPYTTYQFDINGTYRQNREAINEGKKQSYVHGKWKLEGNAFTIDENDTKNGKSEPFVSPMVWVNKNRFYIYGTEGPGGPVVYTYFDRIE
jgi:hypothetical protein